MEAGLEIVDRAKMPAYLESSKEENISFYQRYGFEVLDKCTPIKNCPPEWTMLRPASR